MGWVRFGAAWFVERASWNFVRVGGWYVAIGSFGLKLAAAIMHGRGRKDDGN